ncbi:hypothetical protein TSUD_372780 [Trifolium subterraneum]|uniref:Uncharacterized protein n=1 Tax=Trifolium subterraneum TaxID=3900 RepID=A0A2Z6N2V5_TRISU|nr:hypothetical protein TSUD_372780 [Trifolium subterraneum]
MASRVVQMANGERSFHAAKPVVSKLAAMAKQVASKLAAMAKQVAHEVASQELQECHHQSP